MPAQARRKLARVTYSPRPCWLQTASKRLKWIVCATVSRWMGPNRSSMALSVASLSFAASKSRP